MRFPEYWNYLDRPETFVAYAAASAVLSVPADTPMQHRRFKRWSWPNARGSPLLVYKRLSAWSVVEIAEWQKAHGVHRNMSKESHASHTTLPWESSFGYVKPLKPTLQHQMTCSSVQLGGRRYRPTNTRRDTQRICYTSCRH